jgi:organic hydroperoxide reductase OsmC/OhrA
MTTFPHHYSVTASGAARGDVTLTADLLPALRSASPIEFGGPGDQWSPETLLVGAVADCFILTFRAIAAASRLQWTSLRCAAVGTLDRIDRVTQFTHIALRVQLSIPADASADQAQRALEKAKHACLITSSLKATTQLEIAIDQARETVGDELREYADALE